MSESIFFDVIARDKASSTFSRVGKASDTAHGRLLRFSKGAIGAAAGFTSITLAAGAFLRVGSDYVGSLNKIQALTGASDAVTKRAAQTLESQSSAYAKMGQTTGDAAGGVVELTKAGLSLDKSLKAVNATMVLAKAGELEVSDASSLVANTLNTFNLKASQAGDIANYLANAANISSADVSDLAESFKYVAPVAAATGVSLKQTNAILAELSNSGIAASNAGTGFRKFLLSLQAPSGAAAKDLKELGVQIFDASGKMKPLGTVIDILGGKLGKLTDERRQKIMKDVFGLQGVSAAQVILKNGSKGLDEYTRGVGKAGAAQKLAESASKGFAGTLSSLRAEVISDAQAAYRKFSPAMDDAAKKVLAFIQQMKSGKGAGGDFANALKTIADVGKTAVRFLDELPGPVKKFGVEGLIAYAVLRKLTAATSGFGASLASPIARTKQFYAEMTYAETRAQKLSTTTRALGGALTNVAGTGGMLLLADSTGRAGTKMGLLESAAGGALSGAALGAFGGPPGAAIGAAIGGIAGATLSLMHNTKNAGNAAKVSIGSWREYAQTLTGVSAATTKATRDMAFQRLESSGLLAATRTLGLTDREAVNAMLGQTGARRKLADAMRSQNTITKEQKAALERETGAVGASRLAQLQHNVAVAGSREELRKAKKALQDFMAEPASKRVSIEGVESAKAQLSSLRTALRQVWGLAKDVKTSGSGGLGVLLHPGGGGGGGGKGGKSSERLPGGDRGSERSMESSGRMLGEAYARGVERSRSSVKKALDRFEDLASKAADKLSNLKDVREGFLSTFQGESIFGADLSGGGGLGALLDFEQKQADQAAQLFADIQRVAGMGLSKSLISQLQSQGTSGAQALHALASGSAAQIQQFNALDVQTQSNLQAAGMFAGNTVRGGSVDADIKRAAAEDARLERLVKRLHELQGDDVVVIQIDSEEIIRVIKKRNRRKGVPTAGM